MRHDPPKCSHKSCTIGELRSVPQYWPQAPVSSLQVHFLPLPEGVEHSLTAHHSCRNREMSNQIRLLRTCGFELRLQILMSARTWQGNTYSEHDSPNPRYDMHLCLGVALAHLQISLKYHEGALHSLCRSRDNARCYRCHDKPLLACRASCAEWSWDSSDSRSSLAASKPSMAQHGTQAPQVGC